MHINFDLGLQKLGVSSRRKFYPEQKDVLLNMAVDDFIREAVTDVAGDEEWFHKLQVDVDKVKTLLVRDRELTPYQATAMYTSLRRAILQLPSDYAYLVSDKEGLKKQCTTTPIATASSTEYAIPIPIENSVVDGTYLKHYQRLLLVVNAVTVIDLQNDLKNGLIASLYTGYTSAEEKFAARDLILEVFQEKKRRGQLGSNILDLHWERYGDLYYPNQFILIISSNHSAVFTINATARTYTNTALTTSKSTNTLESYYPSRLARANHIDTILGTPFLKPIKNSPVAVIADNTLQVYTPESVIVSKVALTYIRKPSKINVTLQRNCELPVEFHQNIVDRAVKYAAGRLEQAPLYEIEKDRQKQ